MKRSVVLMVACLALAGGTWLAPIVFGQAAETRPAETEPAEETYTVTKSKLEKYVADKVAAAVAAEREGPRRKSLLPPGPSATSRCSSLYPVRQMESAHGLGMIG